MIWISRRTHGFIDYLLGLFVLLSPMLFHFKDAPTRGIAFAFGALSLFYSLITDYDLALLRFVPFPVHRFLDILWAILLGLAPLHFAVGGRAAVVFGLAGLVALVSAFATRGSFSDTGNDKPLFPWMR